MANSRSSFGRCRLTSPLRETVNISPSPNGQNQGQAVARFWQPVNSILIRYPGTHMSRAAHAVTDRPPTRPVCFFGHAKLAYQTSSADTGDTGPLSGNTGIGTFVPGIEESAV